MRRNVKINLRRIIKSKHGKSSSYCTLLSAQFFYAGALSSDEEDEEEDDDDDDADADADDDEKDD